MSWEPIVKTTGTAVANLVDYDSTRSTFSWGRVRAELDGLPGGRGLNIAHEAVDRHALGPRGDRVALRCLGRKEGMTELSYADLRRQTNRFANLLRRLGVGPQERVFTLLGRVPELYVAALGTLKNTSVLAPLFSAFGPEPVRERLRLGDARVLVTTAELYKRRVAPIRAGLPGLAHVLVAADDPAAAATIDGGVDLATALAESDDEFEIPPTSPEDMALLHFTSGTTGKPKGAVHVHEAVVAPTM